MPEFHVLQSIWGMDRVRSGHGAEWSMPERLSMIRDAGFDGVSAHFHSAPDVACWIEQALDYGFVIEGAAFPQSVDDLRPALELAGRYRIHHLVVQGDVRPYNADAAVPIVEGWQRLSCEYGVPVLIETHRNTITNDLWTTRELLDRVPGLPLLADLSHYVCGQEIHVPPTPRNDALVDRILKHADAYHGRVASSEQIQLEIGFECYRPWVDQFLAWWERGFGYWLARASDDDSLTFACELGPAPYAISDRDGQDRSNRWDDARQMREWVLACWERAVVQHRQDDCVTRR
ncbi:sugar phosphate isomerase/epimerase family protein [Burkholderia sp. MR1-5-21]